MADLLAKVKAAALFIWEFLIPHVVTEDVALEYVGDDISTDWTEWSSYSIACCMADVQPGEVFDAVAEVESLTWLGIGITYRIGNFRPWQAPRSAA